ncbi:MAG: MFS transporter [Blautia sp.]|jgi:MFS family permease
MAQGKNKKVIAAGLLVMSLTMACNSALAPILAEIGKYFPDAGDSAIQIVLTLINLTTLPAMFIEPLLEPKITKRDIAVIGTVLMMAGGLLPQVFNSQLWMLYVASIVIGVGLSFVVVTSSSLISDYFTGLEKSRVMGFQSIFVSIGGTIIAKGSGLLTAMAGWKRGYLVFLIALPIVLIILFTVPKGETTPKAEKGENSGISGSMIYFGVLCLITGIFVATFNTNIAMYIDRKGIGDASTAGTVAAIMQVIGILGGLVLGNTVKIFKRFTIGAAILLMAAGTAMVGFSTSMPVICIGAAVVGFGFAIRNPGAVTFAANMVPAAKASMAIAIVSATYNVGNFISAYVVNAMANIMGDDIANRFIVSAVALIIIGVIACVKAPTTDAQALDSQGE